MPSLFGSTWVLGYQVVGVLRVPSMEESGKWNPLKGYVGVKGLGVYKV